MPDQSPVGTDTDVTTASVIRVVDETCECSPDGKCEHNGIAASVGTDTATPVRQARPADAPTSYRELAAVLGSVGLLLREARRARGLSLREAARQLGTSFATVSRAEAGDDLVLSNAVRILAWLDQTEIEGTTTDV